MSDPRQLSMLAELAHERRDAAAKRLARAAAAHKESQSKLDLLERYREDYRQRLADAAAQGLAGDELRNFRMFLTRLDQAIEQQRAEAEALLRGMNDCRTRWMSERRRERSFDVLVDRADLATRQRDDRRVQKLMDEFAGRLAMLRASVG
ncbi:MAG: flagellar export protein FliJ [Betaproteobacteria bacterium]|jgi:flagellar FliJ protein|nr:flagellar export protein FliJ [Betaproteobacteria bacterium]